MNLARSRSGVPKDSWFLMVLVALLSMLPVCGMATGYLFPVVAGVRQGDLTLFYVALGCALVGVTLLFCAKWPLYRQGKYVTFGSSPLPPRSRPIYRLAYAFIATTLVLLLFLLAALETKD